jgi:hypothetical protein
MIVLGAKKVFSIQLRTAIFQGLLGRSCRLEHSNLDRRCRVKVPLSYGALGLVVGLSFGIASSIRAAEDDALLNDASSIFAALPANFATAERPITPALVELGRALFFDPRMSVDSTASCARCHQPALYGADALAKSHGNHDRLNARNAPTVLNAALQVKQHWTGNREDVEDQATKALMGLRASAIRTSTPRWRGSRRSPARLRRRIGERRSARTSAP